MSWRTRLPEGAALLGILHGSRAFGPPVQASLGLTNRCNVRCAHCYYYSPHIENPNFFQARRARRAGETLDRGYYERFRKTEADGDRLAGVLESLLQLGTRRFLFSGNGEPFLHPRALPLMKRAKQAGARCVANTNGTLLRREIADELIGMGFDELRVTTMAGSRETWAETHPGSPGEMFDELQTNLRHLAEQKARRGLRRPEISLVSVIVSLNCDGIADFARFAAEMRADRVIYRLFDDVGDRGFAPLIPTAGQVEGAKRQLAEARAYLDSEGIPHNIPNAVQVFRDQLDTTEFSRVVPCYYGWLAMRIDVDGKVYPCCRCYEPLGNAWQQEPREIWFGAEYRRFRGEALALNRRRTPVGGCDCNRCVHHNANLRVFRLLHPVKGNASRLGGVLPSNPFGSAE